MNESKTGMKLVFIVVLFLIILPLAIFAFLRCFQPVPESSATSGTAVSQDADTEKSTARERRARHETRTVREETTVVETTVVETAEPVPVFEEVGAISPYRDGKKATPYAPGEVPGDSGVVVQYAGSPNDGMSGPEPPSPDDDLWGGAVMPPMTPEQMRGIGGVRRVDPNDPFFRQDIPNPFER